MPSVKISELLVTSPASALAGTEGFEVTQVGDTKGATANQIKTFVLTGLASTSISYTPSGGISANTVAAAIAELDTEKMGKAGDTAIGVYTFLVVTHTPQTPVSGTSIHLSGDGSQTRFLLDNYQNFPGGGIFTGRKARGTSAAPLAVNSGDQLVQIQAFGYGATGYSASSRGGLSVQSTETWTDTAQGTRIVFFTTPIGALSGATVRLTIDDTKLDLGVGVALNLNAVPVIGADRLIRLRSYTVATLPTAGTAGRKAFASDGRAFNGAGTQEGIGAGTGVEVVDNGTAWKIAGTNVTVVA